MSGHYPPSVLLATLYERTSQRGTRYMTGRLGAVRVTLLPGEPAEDGTPTWRLLLAEAPKSEAQSRPAAPDAPPEATGRRASSPRRPYRRPLARPREGDGAADPRPFDDALDDVGRAP